MSNHKYCTQCHSQNIYLSLNGYDTAVVCIDCNYEEHDPYAKLVPRISEHMDTETITDDKGWKDMITDIGGEG